jgi:hypothetical protein
MYLASCIAQGIGRTRDAHKKVRRINILIPILRLDVVSNRLTIPHRKIIPIDAPEVSDLSAKIMAAMAERHGTAASTRVNCA